MNAIHLDLVNRYINAFGQKYFRKLDDEKAIYEIKSPKIFKNKAFEDNKLSLLEAFLKINSINYVRNSDNPFENQSIKKISTVKDDTWIIPSEIDIKLFYKELYLGGWEIFSSSSALDKEQWNLYDPYNTTDLKRLITEMNISSILVSFHDNDPWIMAFNQ